MTEDKAINIIQYRIDTASHIAGRGIDGKAYEDLELAVKALKTVSKIVEVVKTEQQPTSCEHTKLKSFQKIEQIIADYQLSP